MKIRVLVKPIIVLVISLLAGLLVTAKSNTIHYLFLKKFELMKISKQLKVVRIRNDDQFEWPLQKCIPGFYHDLIGLKGYYLVDKKKINNISITEYVFKDTTAANTAYHKAYDYAESVRKLTREQFTELCFKMPSPQIYYASKEDNHVYIYSEYYNFIYYSGKESVETNMNNDQRILLDDIYKQMTSVQK